MVRAMGHPWFGSKATSVEPRRQHPPGALAHPVHAPREPRPEALHAVGEARLVVRLHQEVGVVVLHGVVRDPEPGPRRRTAQRLPERPHEARPAQRRHVVEHAQRDQHGAFAGDRLPGAVRNPRPPHPPPSGPGAGAAAARRAELERGLPGILATLPLHCGCHRWVLRMGESLRRNTVHVNSVRANRRRIPGLPQLERPHGPARHRRPRRAAALAMFLPQDRARSGCAVFPRRRMKGAMLSRRTALPAPNKAPAVARFPRFVHGAGPRNQPRRGGPGT